MVQTDEIERILTDLGFTQYEIKVIRELYTRGPLKADEVAKYSEVPLARTYNTLDTLKQKNFVTSSQGRPRLYTAINPQVAISSIVDQEKVRFSQIITKFSALGNSLLDLVHPLYVKSHTQIEPEDLLSQLSSLKEAEEFTLRLIDSARVEILIFSHVFNWFSKVKTSLENAIKRGCEVKLLMQTELKDQDTNPIELRKMGIQVRTIPNKGIMTRGTLVDHKTVIFVIWASEGSEIEKPRRIYHPHYSSNAGIIDVFESYFNFLWNID
jgi:sugar-specific transcriptional regulator TrmB